MKSNFTRQVAVGFGVTSLVLVSIGSFWLYSMLDFVSTARWVEHSHLVLEDLEHIISGLRYAESGSRGYIITGREDFLPPYNRAKADVATDVAELMELTRDNASQQQRVATLKPLIAQRCAILEHAMHLRRQYGFEVAQKRVIKGTGRYVMMQIQDFIQVMAREELHLLQQRKEKAGSRANSILYASVLGILGLILLLMLVYRLIKAEVAERHQAEASLDQKNRVLEYALEGISLISAKGYFVTVNKTFAAMVGYEPADIIGQHWEVTLAPEDREKLQTALNQLQAQGKAELVAQGVRKNGTLFYEQVVLIANAESHGRTGGYFFFTKDITERKALELELMRNLEHLKESESLRTTFVSTITHDLRTPLIAQKRVLEVLDGESRIREDVHLAGIMGGFRKNNEHLLLMVNKLLETYQYEDGRIKLALETVNLPLLVDECFGTIESLAMANNIALEKNFSPDLPEVWGDYYQLKRVFVNLMGNALENMQAGGFIRVTIEVEPEAIIIMVEDNGPGIPRNILPYVFDRYFTGHATRHKIGSGLGLYICKMIVELHGGTITAHSHPGEGTLMSFTLPRLLQK